MTKLLPPHNVGESILVEIEDGSKRYYTVIDEIVLVKSDSPNRALCFQRLRYRDTDQIQLRACYYFATEREWMFTHNTPYILERDFQTITREAVKRGWIKLNP